MFVNNKTLCARMGEQQNNLAVVIIDEYSADDQIISNQVNVILKARSMNAPIFLVGLRNTEDGLNKTLLINILQPFLYFQKNHNANESCNAFGNPALAEAVKKNKYLVVMGGRAEQCVRISIAGFPGLKNSSNKTETNYEGALGLGHVVLTSDQVLHGKGPLKNLLAGCNTVFNWCLSNEVEIYDQVGS